MKFKSILLPIVALSLLLCACNDTTITTEPESAPAPSASEEYTPDLTLARQVFDRLQANEGGTFTTEGRYALSQHLMAETPKYKNYKWIEYYAYEDVNAPVFPSSEQVEKVTQGLFINEVYDLLGRPHYNASNNGAYHNGEYYYTMHVLEDGTVLLLGYSAILAGNYKMAELTERIPCLEEAGGTVFVDDGAWRVLTFVKRTDIEELSAMGWGSDENLYTVPDEYLPPEIFKEDVEKIHEEVIRKGKTCTYKEIKELLGSCGYCIDINGISDPPYTLLPDKQKDPAYVYKFMWVIKDGPGSAGNLFFVDFHAPAENGEYFDDMIASCVEVIEAYW